MPPNRFAFMGSMILGPATTFWSEWFQVLCVFTSHTIIQGTQFSPPLALYNPTRDLKGSYSLSFFLILHLINALTNLCAPTKTPVRTSHQSTSLHNEQSSNGGHFDLDATEVDGLRKYGRRNRSTSKNVDEVSKRSWSGRRRRWKSPKDCQRRRRMTRWKDRYWG
jgi:hypothetical protein